MKIMWLPVVFLLAACVTAPKAGSDAVRVTINNQETVGCTFVGDVSADDMWEEGDSKVALRNQALEKGGNLVLLGRKTGTMQHGEAYNCAPKP